MSTTTRFFVPTGAITNTLLGPDSVTSAKLASDAGSMGEVSGGVMFSSGSKIGVGSSSIGASTNARLTVEDSDNQIVLRQTSAGGSAAALVYNTVPGNPSFHIQRRSTAGVFQFTAVTVNLDSGAVSVAGNMSAASCTCPSDVRLKENITDLDNALNTLLAIRSVEFDWRDPERAADGGCRQIGFVAQELREVVPEVVHHNADGYYGVDYGRLTPLLTAAIQELHGQLNEKEQRLVELEARVAEQERRWATQQERIEAQAQRLSALEARLGGMESSR
jgi:hypothetical protein